MSKKSVLLLVFAVVLVLVIGAWVVWKTFIAPPAFYAVQLSTGEMYFGRIAHFPYGLKEVYLLTQTGDKEQPVSVQKFVNSLIGPEDRLRLNKDNIVWTARLDNEGQLAQTLIKGRTSAGNEVPSETEGTAPVSAQTAPSK